MITKELIEDAKASGFEDYFHEANVNTSATLKLETRLAKFAELQRQSERQAVALPDARPLHDKDLADDEPRQDSRTIYFYRMGWNQCRDAMLAAAPPADTVKQEKLMTENDALSGIREIIDKQEPLPYEMAKILYDNLWDLYQGSDDCPHPIVEELTK